MSWEPVKEGSREVGETRSWIWKAGGGRSSQEMEGTRSRESKSRQKPLEKQWREKAEGWLKRQGQGAKAGWESKPGGGWDWGRWPGETAGARKAGQQEAGTGKAGS